MAAYTLSLDAPVLAPRLRAGRCRQALPFWVCDHPPCFTDAAGTTPETGSKMSKTNTTNPIWASHATLLVCVLLHSMPRSCLRADSSHIDTGIAAISTDHR